MSEGKRGCVKRTPAKTQFKRDLRKRSNHGRRGERLRLLLLLHGLLLACCYYTNSSPKHIGSKDELFRIFRQRANPNPYNPNSESIYRKTNSEKIRVARDWFFSFISREEGRQGKTPGQTLCGPLPPPPGGEATGRFVYPPAITSHREDS